MKRKLLWLVPVLLMAGCISAATIQSYLPVFESTVNAVVVLISPNPSPAIQADKQKIVAGLTDVVSAVTNIQGSPTISAALSAVESAANQLETDLGLGGNRDAQLAVGILDIGIGTYQGIVAAHTQSTPAGPVAAAHTSMSVPAKVRPAASSLGDYKRKFNALCRQYGHPEMQMKLSMAERVHLR